MLDGLYPFTEDLSWIEDIIRNKLVSRGNRLIEPKIITFYNPLESKEK
jgi:ATP phosphoribosyltransferase regulatory subunit HisZ